MDALILRTWVRSSPPLVVGANDQWMMLKFSVSCILADDGWSPSLSDGRKHPADLSELRTLDPPCDRWSDHCWN